MWGVALPKGPGVLGEIGNFLVLHNVLQWKKGGTTKEGGATKGKRAWGAASSDPMSARDTVIFMFIIVVSLLIY